MTIGNGVSFLIWSEEKTIYVFPHHFYFKVTFGG